MTRLRFNANHLTCTAFHRTPFAEASPAFLVPFYYLLLAVMNGIAALLSVAAVGPVTYFAFDCRTVVPVTNAMVWIAGRAGFMVAAPSMAAGNELR